MGHHTGQVFVIERPQVFQGATDIFGYSADEAQGRPAAELIVPRELREVVNILVVNAVEAEMMGTEPVCCLPSAAEAATLARTAELEASANRARADADRAQQRINELQVQLLQAESARSNAAWTYVLGAMFLAALVTTLAERGRIVEWNPQGLPLRVVGTLSDITLRREAESRVIAMAEQLSETARHVPGVIYQYRHTGEGHSAFTYVSESCQAVLGVPADELLRDGSKVLQMMEREYLGSVVSGMKASARTLAPWRFDFRLRRPDRPGGSDPLPRA